MSDSRQKPTAYQPGLYEIRVLGHIPHSRKEWFEGMEILAEPDGQTVLRGRLADQSALHGVLNKIRDLNISLLAVQRIETGPE